MQTGDFSISLKCRLLIGALPNAYPSTTAVPSQITDNPNGGPSAPVPAPVGSVNLN